MKARLLSLPLAPQAEELAEKNKALLGSPSLSLRKKIGKKNFLLLCSVEGSELTGYLEAELLEETARINCIAVNEKKRKKGIASFLLSRALSILREKGIESVFLLVKSENFAAKEFFEKHGFGFSELLESGGEEIEKMETGLFSQNPAYVS